MKLTLSTLLASIALLTPQALAIEESLAIDLQYAVRNAEALYGIATADGDLRFINQGPSATKLRWFDPMRGEEENRVLLPGQALLSQGQIGARVSEGTVVLVEKVGSGPFATGIASLPATRALHDSVHCLHNNGAFLPWHRGYFTSTLSLVGGTMCSIESHEGAIGVLSSQEMGALIIQLSKRQLNLNLEHGPGVQLSMQIREGTSGQGGQETAPFQSPNGHVLWSIQGAGPVSLEHGPGLHDSVHCLQPALGWVPCPPYEPFTANLKRGHVHISLGENDQSVWTTGPVTSFWDWSNERRSSEIWRVTTIIAIAPDGTVDL